MKNPSLKSALAHIFLAGSVGLGILATAGYAQTAYGSRILVADIPFSFTSGSEIMPPGKYRLMQLPQHMIQIRSEDLKHVRYLLTMTSQTFQIADRSKLVFHRYGDQYFLYQVWAAGSMQHAEILRGHAEQEMLSAQNHPRPSNTEVATSAAPR